MGFLFFSFRLGAPTLIFFHLITHAFFKRCLFLQVGVFIHWIYSLQDARGYNNTVYTSLFRNRVVTICLFSICGILFSRGFISKDIILSSFNITFLSIIFYIIIFFIILLTYVYSFQLFRIIIQTLYKTTHYSEQELKIIKIFSVRLIILGITGG
jgi:NADH:ubiquinone oxidoreductase subunit 5 (subunit L)/multisubunit Na+/H+ antiporter MnhA subunit